MRPIRLIDPGTPNGRTTGYHRQIAETSNETWASWWTAGCCAMAATGAGICQKRRTPLNAASPRRG
jgi:hypothetical protein